MATDGRASPRGLQRPDSRTRTSSSFSDSIIDQMLMACHCGLGAPPRQARRPPIPDRHRRRQGTDSQREGRGGDDITPPAICLGAKPRTPIWSRSLSASALNSSATARTGLAHAPLAVRAKTASSFTGRRASSVGHRARRAMPSIWSSTLLGCSKIEALEFVLGKKVGVGAQDGRPAASADTDKASERRGRK